MIRLFALAAITMLAAGCQSNDSHTQYYQLATAPVANEVKPSAAQLIIDQVVLVDFLRRPNILLKQENNTLFVTNYHVWAEPLDKAIARTMVNFINQDSMQLRAEHQLLKQCTKNDCYRLSLFVEAFYPSSQSQVQFSGKYKLHHGDNVVVQQDFNLVNDLEIDGYPHAVEKLQQLIYQLSSHIEQKLTSEGTQ